MKKIIRRGLLLFCIAFGWSLTFSQTIDPRGGLGNSRQDSIPPGLMPLDTPVPARYVLIGDETKFYKEKDTFSWKDVRHDPLGFGFAHLGNLGSAYHPLVPQTIEPIGFSTGWLQYEPYYIQEDSFRYYTQHIPIAKIKYSQARKENTYLTLSFGRSFAKGLSLSIYYSKINQAGQFFHQQQKDTGLGFGVWHHAPSGKYDAFYNLISNSASAQENGGVSAPDSIGRPAFPDEAIPTFLRDGVTNHKHRVFLTKQIVHLISDSASIGIDLWIKAKYETGLFKYSDKEAATYSDYYNPPVLPEDRGIRQFTFSREHQESIGISLPWKKAHSIVEGSLRYRGIHLEQEPLVRKIKELYLDANAAFHWIEPLMLKGELSLGLGKAAGSYSFKASGDLAAGILGHFKGHWIVQNRQPYLVESRLFVNQDPVYQEDFNNLFKTEIGISWHNEKLDFQTGVSWKAIDQYIYFDTSALPVQLDESFSVKQFYVQKGFDLKWGGLQARFIYQPDPKRELAIPDKLFNASLYGKVKFFQRRLTVLPVVDLTYYSSYAGISYFPVNGVYHLTGREAIPDYVRLDIGIGIRVNFIKVFARVEDFPGFFKDRALYQADFYPHYRGYFRIGMEAGFYN